MGNHSICIFHITHKCKFIFISRLFSKEGRIIQGFGVYIGLYSHTQWSLQSYEYKGYILRFHKAQKVHHLETEPDNANKRRRLKWYFSAKYTYWNTYVMAADEKKVMSKLHMWPKFLAVKIMSHISCHGGNN